MTFPFVVWKLISYPGSKHFPFRERDRVGERERERVYLQPSAERYFCTGLWVPFMACKRLKQ